MTVRTEGNPGPHPIERAFSGLKVQFREWNMDIEVDPFPLGKVQTLQVQRLLRHPHPNGRDIREYVAMRAVPLDLISDADFNLEEGEIRDIAQDMGTSLSDQSMRNAKIVHWMTEALVYARSVDQVKTNTTGRDASVAESTYITSLAMERAGWLVGLDQYNRLHDAPEVAGGMDRLGRLALSDPDPHVSWYGPKVLMFSYGMHDAYNMAKYMEALAVPDIAPEGEQVTVEQWREANDGLFEETRSLARYAVKSAIVPAHNGTRIQEWLVLDPLSDQQVFIDSEYDLENTHAKYHKSHLATFIAKAGKFSTTEMTKHAVKSPDGKASLITMGAAVDEEDITSEFFPVRLARDGSLRTSMGFDIREYLEQMGGGLLEYEQMRAEILSIYSDLVTPVYVHELTEEDAVEAKTKAHGSRRGEAPRPTLYDLVLARKRIIELFKPDIEADLKKELDEHTTEVVVQEPKEKRLMVKHEVAGHVRKLAPNQRASAEARKLAWEQGPEVVLKEYGETWERTHFRGDLPNPSRGHRARRTHRTTTEAGTGGQERVVFEPGVNPKQ